MIAPLRTIWATLDGPTGERLAPFMAEVIEATPVRRLDEAEPARELRLTWSMQPKADEVPTWEQSARHSTV